MLDEDAYSLRRTLKERNLMVSDDMKGILGKICLLCDSSVGKTSLIRRFMYKRFDEKYVSTLGTTVSKKMILLYSLKSELNIELQLLIWDVSGPRELKRIPRSYKEGRMS